MAINVNMADVLVIRDLSLINCSKFKKIVENLVMLLINIPNIFYWSENKIHKEKSK